MAEEHRLLIRRQREALALSKFVGTSPVFRQAIATVSAAAVSDAAVLVAGETGTGKELVARAVHYLSARAAEPFVAVNCGSLTDTLLEDELFGHERGAFTDARQRRGGLLAQAERGTLFLDEIDTLTPRGQVALLRVLQDKVYRPLGAEREYQAQVRFVAASNQPLRAAVDAGTFRADLYYRVSVFTITLPPLRERREDVLPLAHHFLAKHCPAGEPLPTISAEACEALTAFSWPGNVRELENAMIRAVRLCESPAIEIGHLQLPGASAGNGSTAPGRLGTFRMLKRELLQTFEQDYLARAMREADGNVTRAAQIAGKDRRDFGKLLKKHGLAGVRFPRTG
jgi:DNA-binding NtrC family response regulator